MDPTNSIWEGITPSHGTTHAEAAVSECGTCVAYFKRRYTNVTNVNNKKILAQPKSEAAHRPKSEAAHRELSRFSRLPTTALVDCYRKPAHFTEYIFFFFIGVSHPLQPLTVNKESAS